MELNIFLGGCDMDFSKDTENVKSSFKTYALFKDIFKEAFVAFLACSAVYVVAFLLKGESNSNFLKMIFITATVFVIIASFILIVSMASLIITFKNLNKFSSHTADFDKNMAEFERIITDKYNVACALAIGYNIMYNELYEIMKQCNQGKKLEKFEKLKTFGGMAEVLSKKTADKSLSSLLKTVGDDWAE